MYSIIKAQRYPYSKDSFFPTFSQDQQRDGILKLVDAKFYLVEWRKIKNRIPELEEKIREACPGSIQEYRRLRAYYRLQDEQQMRVTIEINE